MSDFLLLPHGEGDDEYIVVGAAGAGAAEVTPHLIMMMVRPRLVPGLFVYCFYGLCSLCRRSRLAFWIGCGREEVDGRKGCLRIFLLTD